MRFVIGGAGLSGATLARALAEAGHSCTVVEPASHVAGHCHSERDEETGVLVHCFGPHVFHTEDERVWAFVRRFAEMQPFRYRVRAVHGGELYSLPVNLSTINQLFRAAMTPEEAREYVASLAEPFRNGPPVTLEQQGLATVGRDLFEAFFRGYSEKQWGRPASEMPAGVLKRLPVRFVEDDSYFDHPYQALPAGGYTAMVERILDHERVTLVLSETLQRGDAPEADHLFFTGPLDAWFRQSLGRLAYRTLSFEDFRRDGDFQDVPVVNYPDRRVPWTRITEHKHLAPWEQHERTICSREFSREAGPDDPPYYPVRLARGETLLARYVELAHAERGVTFLGRLGTYRYLDMDSAVGEALDAADRAISLLSAGAELPPFFVDPLGA
jgi:UDP-galactopyranose mutase